VSAVSVIEQSHRPVQIAANLQDQRLIAESAHQLVSVSRFAANSLSFFVRRHLMCGVGPSSDPPALRELVRGRSAKRLGSSGTLRAY